MLQLQNYSPQDLKRIQTEIISELCIRYMRHFFLASWHIIEPSFDYISNWHIDAICDVLQYVYTGEIRRLLINMPPGHAKSSIVSVGFPAWVWAKDPGRRFICASYESNLSVRDNIRTANIIQSEWYQKTFVKNQWHITKDTEGWLINDKSGFKLATSVGGKGTGWRADTILIDDPLNAIDAKSPAKREEARFWLDKAISSRLKDPRTGQIVIVMQRLHEEDPSGHVLKQGGYEHLCLPTEYNPKEKCYIKIDDRTIFEDPRTEDKELLFSKLYTERVIALAKKVLGSDGFAGQHNQRPTAVEGGLFKRAHWRFFKKSDEPLQKTLRPDGCTDVDPVLVPDNFDQVLLSIDCSFKETKKGSHVVFMVIGVSKANKYILHVVRARMSFTRTIAVLVELKEIYPKINRALIEDKANGSAVIDTLKGYIAGLIAIEPDGGKESRATACQPHVESGNIYLLDGAPWLSEFVKEFGDFPNGSSDDQVDALSQAVIYLTGKADRFNILAMSKM